MTNDISNVPVETQAGLSLFPSQNQAVEQILDDLIQKCPALFILLVETSGQLISVQGEKGNIDLVALGALIAGDLAASQEIARLTGQYQHAQLILREGPKTNTFLSEAGPQLALYMKIDKEVPLGWARLLIQVASEQLADVVSAHPADLEKLDLGLSDEKLNGLIGDSLDSMWKEGTCI